LLQCEGNAYIWSYNQRSGRYIGPEDEELRIINWDIFINGEAELECETINDAELLLSVCKENNINVDYIDPDDFSEEPYWYIKGGDLMITRYCCENDDICSCWTVREFVENHKENI